MSTTQAVNEQRSTKSQLQSSALVQMSGAGTGMESASTMAGMHGMMAQGNDAVRGAYGGLPGILQLSSHGQKGKSGGTGPLTTIQMDGKGGKSDDDAPAAAQMDGKGGKSDDDAPAAAQMDGKGGKSDDDARAAAAASVDPGPQLDFIAQASKNSDWAELLTRLAKPENAALNNDAFKLKCAKYVVAMGSGDAAQIQAAGEVVTSDMQKSGAFALPDGKGHFWSGTKDNAKEAAGAEGGKVLETTTAGALFDGLGFGVEKKDWFAKLGPLWNSLSRNYAKGVSGNVKIHQYVGLCKGNIFDTVEYPVLQDLIKDGIVSDMTFMIYYNSGPVDKAVRKHHTTLDKQKDISKLTQYERGKEPNGGYPPDKKPGDTW
ncbi:MAG: hypothetical protein ACKO6N_12195 [Myxococcota bacterium]